MTTTLPVLDDAEASVRKRAALPARSLRRKGLLLRWATIATLLGIWQLKLGSGSDNNSYFAAPAHIVRDGVPYLRDPAVITGLTQTAREFLIAFALAGVFGVVVGVLLGLSHRLGPVGSDAAYLLYTLPQVPFYPLFILWLGTGTKSEIAFGISHGIMPIVLTTVAAAQRADPSLIAALRAMGANRRTVVRQVVLPSMVPDLITALRVGASLSLIGVLVAQVLVSIDGVGGLIAQLSGSLQAARLDAVVLAVCIAAVLVNVVLRLVERRLSRWRP